MADADALLLDSLFVSFPGNKKATWEERRILRHTSPEEHIWPIEKTPGMGERVRLSLHLCTARALNHGNQRFNDW